MLASWAVVGLLVAASSGCARAVGEDDPAVLDDGRPLVLTTFTVLADMAANVAGDHLRVESITKAGAEIHGYEPTPGDLRTAEQAELILDNGLGLEAWFEKFVERIPAPHAVVSANVDPIYIRDDAYAGKANPHAWMSPVVAETYVENIADAFVALDPANTDDYRANAAAYVGQLREVGAELAADLSGLPARQRALVTCEGAFGYLARDFDLQEAYLWPVNAEQEGTPKQVVRTIDFVRDNDVPAVFCESTVSDKAQLQVAEDTGARFGGQLYVDSLSDATGPVPTYLDLLRYDARLIADALVGER
ncbi:metal ABC transporter substrate-binding protein [Rhodococcus sp. 05-2254-6]|nr:iron-binding protein [Rhodococcus sp. EPR-279]KZF04068.1 iron-binding protein [Rhodococcus sp. EPR-147]OZE29032.1 metal ABC transporter substrate-binding protein [Rhodococcus sp. 05-2254-6]OZE31997.1 metal ABC transporter substrate-binding protein [Rhodococcus sp. 05-2254-4]OZE42852.1 metal ABC transporter substrate-binding protein [Rhodococcus sp. 05-2254-3]OZE47010.1 metal ABC transporter substrate-binding protein [Rhodococcus sp. 05-2254-2]